MTVNVGVRRILTRTAGARAAVAAAAAAGLLMAAAPASAAPGSAAASATVSATATAAAAAAQASARTHVYRTLVTGLAVREAATDTSLKRAVLGAAGTKVQVQCFTVGQPINGDNIWYMITAPHAGLVVGFYINTGNDPALGVPSCGKRAVQRVFRTLVSGLAVRKAASSVSAKRAALGHRGTKVTVSCYAIGQPVSGDDVWYRIIAPHSGMVSGFYLATGRDPATGVSPC